MFTGRSTREFVYFSRLVKESLERQHNASNIIILNNLSREKCISGAKIMNSFSKSSVAMIDLIAEKVFPMIIRHRSVQKLPSSGLTKSSEATDVRGDGGVDPVRAD